MMYLHGMLLLVSSLLASSSASRLCVDNFENVCKQCDTNITLNDNLQWHLDSYDATFNKEILLCSTEVTLQTSIAITNISFVSIDSYFESSTISCKKKTFGIKFMNTKNVTLRNIQIQSCGGKYYGTSLNISAAGERSHMNLFFQTSMYFLNSTNIEIHRFIALESQGIGLTLINCSGSIVIQYSKFEKSAVFDKRDETIPGGNGLYIEFFHSMPEELHEDFSAEETASHCILINCTFSKNQARSVKEHLTSYVYGKGGNFQGLGRGGGLCVHFRGSTRKNVVKILNCAFTGNQAIWGGGLYVSVQDSATANEVYVDHANFTNNNCTPNGGGGVVAGFLFRDDQQQRKNKLMFSNSVFFSNQAEFGGGALVFSSSSSNFENINNEIMFTWCVWLRNRALFGAAVNFGTHTWDVMRKGLLPTPVFSNCSFISNFVDKINSSIEGKGIFVAVNIDLIFQGKTNFTGNGDTALYLFSSTAKFMKGSHALFERNIGANGGAIKIMSLSSIEINDNSNFSFIGNEAREKGGAIYQVSYNVNDYVVSKICFIHYAGNQNRTERHIYFTFNSNKAGIIDSSNAAAFYGNSIYVGTLKPCFTGCISEQLNETFDCIAFFIFDDDNLSHQISTIGRDIQYHNKSSTLYVTPGAFIVLPFTLHNELSNEVKALYHVYISDHTNSTISLSEDYMSDKKIQVFGHPGDKALLEISTVDVWKVAVSFPIHMSECPPGFSHTSDEQYCECKSFFNRLYSGISECNKVNFSSTMVRGFWYGYAKCHNGLGKESDLVSGYCPLKYCAHQGKHKVTLPNSTNISELDLLICGNRTGTLCAKCRGNLSTFFHTNAYECFPSDDNCKYGILLYLVAEILPITIFFIVTIMLDINFTHGAINGLIFYFQVTDISIHMTSGFVKCSQSLIYLQEMYLLLSGVFNLKFFYHTDLSFCLFHKFQTLDIIAFRYVSIVYALCLVVFIISIMRVCSLRRITQKFPNLLRKSINIKTTIIHGLSGFLVLCYSECSKLSLLILTSENLYYSNETKKVVQFNGELDYLKGRHWIYAFPALFFLTTVGFIPPLLFIVYPFCYKIFALLRINESRFTNKLCYIFPFERFKPFFDSFQSDFKDDFRFYSGLYFFYRMVPLLTFAVTQSITNYLMILLVEFTVFFCLHAIFQPYKKQWHNILDSCIFANLIILTTLTQLGYRRTFNTFNTDHIIEQVCAFQTLFLYAPMVFFLIMLIIQIVKKLKLMKIILQPKVDNSREQELSESLLFTQRDSITESVSQSVPFHHNYKK